MRRKMILGCLLYCLCPAPMIAHADEVKLTLDVVLHDECPDELGGTWRLWAEIVDTGGGADGSFGLSAVRALIDGVDPQVTFATETGAIDPVDPTGNPRPAVLVTDGGTLDILYGQDLSESNGRTVVPGVGVGSSAILASGTFPRNIFPTFGDDDQGLISEALFLNTDMSPYGSAVDADVTLTEETYLVRDCFGADFDGSGAVGNGDLTLLLDNWGATVPPIPTGWVIDLPTEPAVGNDDLTRLLDGWGKSFAAHSHHYHAVPEPAALAIAITSGLVLSLARNRTRRSSL